MISEKCCILEKSRKNLVKFGENSAKFWQNLRIFGKNTAKISAIFNENFEIRERCKGVHCVDLGESFPTSIYLQKSASIQPRTSPVKFARSPCTDPPVRIIIIIITDPPGRIPSLVLRVGEGGEHASFLEYGFELHSGPLELAGLLSPGRLDWLRCVEVGCRYACAMRSSNVCA